MCQQWQELLLQGASYMQPPHICAQLCRNPSATLCSAQCEAARLVGVFTDLPGQSLCPLRQPGSW